MKIAIYTIVKNEEHNVDKWAESNKEADYRLVCDTGSTDSTVEKLEQHNVNVFKIKVDPWRFDIARNTSLNLLPDDIDVCIWQDMDEELLPGWREQIEKNWDSDATIYNHRYRHNKGNWQWHSKIHKRHNCSWTGPIHETLKWSIPEKTVWLHDFYLDETQDTTKDRSNYLKLLIKKIEEGDRDWRTYYFIANEYQSVDLQKSIEYRIKSFDEIDNTDTIIKSFAARNIAKQYFFIQDIETAEKWFKISIDNSNERESAFCFAEFLYHQNRWDECYVIAKKCLSITEQRNGFTFEPAAWGFAIYDIIAIASFNLNLYEQAIEYGKKAIDLNPTDQRLQNNLKFYQEKYEKS